MGSTKYSYYRLRNDSNEGGVSDEESEERAAFRKISSWSKIRRFVGRRRPKVRIPGLRRFWRKRRRFLRKRKRFFTRFKVSWSKVLKRLKNGQAHMSDLFAGNYLFMPVNPTPFRCGERRFMGHDLHGMPSRHDGRIA